MGNVDNSGGALPRSIMPNIVERDMVARDPHVLQFLREAAHYNYINDPIGDMRGPDGNARAWLYAVLDCLTVHGFSVSGPAPRPDEGVFTRTYIDNLITLASRRKTATKVGNGGPNDGTPTPAGV